MATGTDPDSGAKPGEAPRRKGKPATTIDLDAREVTAEAAATGAAPIADPADPVSPAAGEPPETAPGASTAEAAAPEPATREPAEPVVEIRPAATQPPQRGRGALSGLVAAAIGGLIVLAGGIGLERAGIIGPGKPAPAASPEALAALDRRVVALSDRVEDLPAPEPMDLAPLETRLAALEGRASGTGGEEIASLSAELDGLSGRIAALETASPAPAAAASGSGAEMAALRDGLSGMEATLAGLAETVELLRSAPPAVDPAVVETIRTSVDGLAGRLEELGSRVEAVDRRIGSLAETVAAGSGALDQMQGALETARGETGRVLEGVNGGIEALGGRVSEIERRLDAGPKGGEIAALSLALATLTTKLDSGEPFAGDLALLTAGAGDLDLSGLSAVAETGVPTVDRLVESFPADAIAAARPVDPAAGVFDRVLTGAKSLVNYRETGADATDPLSRPLAAAEAALAARDLAAAAAAVAELPDWAKAVASDWTARLQARIAAEGAADALTARLLDRLEAPAEGR